eukprot:bmy_15334T0
MVRWSPQPFLTLKESTAPVTKALSLTLPSWTRRAACPQCWPPRPAPRASLSSLRPPRPRDPGAATRPARPRRPRDPAAQATPSACWTRSCSAWVSPTQPPVLLPESQPETASGPCSRRNGRTWTSSAPNPGLVPVASQMGLSCSPQQPPQATPRPPWSQPAFRPPRQAPSRFPPAWPQLRPPRLSPRPPGTMVQLWATAPCASWTPLISF